MSRVREAIITNGRTANELWEDWRFYLKQHRDHNELLEDEIRGVVDTYHTIHTGLAANFKKELSEATVLELTRLVLKRWDKAEELQRIENQREMDAFYNQNQEEDDNG